jgi:hypothetical protein
VTFAHASKVLGSRDLMDLRGSLSFSDNFDDETVIALDVQWATDGKLVLPTLAKKQGV